MKIVREDHDLRCVRVYPVSRLAEVPVSALVGDILLQQSQRRRTVIEITEPDLDEAGITALFRIVQLIGCRVNCLLVVKSPSLRHELDQRQLPTLVDLHPSVDEAMRAFERQLVSTRPSGAEGTSSLAEFSPDGE